MGTNHLGHFVLFKLIKHLILKSDSPKIIYTSSIAHEWYHQKTLEFVIPDSHDIWLFYQKSKLAMALTAREISVKYPKITSVFLHPGAVRSGIAKVLPKWQQGVWYGLGLLFFKSNYQGCQTNLYCVFHDDLQNGGYYSDCKLKKHNPLVDDDEFRKQFWNDSKNEKKKHKELFE